MGGSGYGIRRLLSMRQQTWTPVRRSVGSSWMRRPGGRPWGFQAEARWTGSLGTVGIGWTHPDSGREVTRRGLWLWPGGLEKAEAWPGSGSGDVRGAGEDKGPAVQLRTQGGGGTTQEKTGHDDDSGRERGSRSS